MASPPPLFNALPVLTDLHVLMVVGQTRSYTQTAKRLNLSKATVSLRMAALERATGIPLVQRTTRAVALTAAGQQLVEDTSASFAHIEQSYIAIRDLAHTPRGLVRMTAPVALGRQHLMPALNAFLQEYTDIKVELDLNDRLTNLAQEGYDLAIRHTHAPPESYVAWPLCSSRSILVASADYLAQFGIPKHPHELSQHRCLTYWRGSNTQTTWTLMRKKRRGPPESCHIPVNGPLKANNSEVLRDAALDNLGIAMLPDFSAATSAQESRRLVTVLPDWEPQGFFGAHIYAIRPWAPQVPKAVQSLIAHLQAWFANGLKAECRET